MNPLPSIPPIINLMQKKTTTILKLLKIQDPKLREKSIPFPIKDILNIEKSENLLLKSFDFHMKTETTIGISAIQMGIPKQIFVGLKRNAIKDKTFETQIFINPKLLHSSKETTLHIEGCLSVEDYGIVERAKEIQIEYYDIKGKKIIEDYDDFEARILLHELDHLDGILFTDLIKNPKWIMKMDQVKEYLTENGDFRYDKVL